MDYPKKIWVNGRLADPRRPAVSAYDHGFLYGDGVYETLRVYNGRLFRFDRHFQRLKHSARSVRIPIPYPGKTIEQGLYRLLEVNRLQDTSLRITLTRGPGPLGFDPRPCRSPSLVLTPGPALRPLDSLFCRGIRLAIVRVRRNARTSLDPAIKSTNNLNNILAKMDAIRSNAFEALMLNVEGYLTEGTVSNVFFVSKGTLRTPDLACGLLAGVTRDIAIHLAKRRGWKVAEGWFKPKDLLTAQEIFLTSTILEIMPVTSIVDEKKRVHRVGAGRAGAWASLLEKDFQDLVSRETGAVISKKKEGRLTNGFMG
ncbi:MAG: aminotransferase class IV [Elusimicrobia bacterium]|nr:aminotransferase class IV [Elusimicrobiota bacterium]